MNKLDMESKNIINENIQKISELFPNVIVESDTGKTIDFDLLKQELSKDIVEGVKEKYQLTWPGKKEAIVNANTPSKNTLRPLKEKSVNFDNTQQVDEEGNRMVTNNQSNGRFHSDWLSMMYSRLKLARNLLTDDGLIFISIDDNEHSNMKKICDEIFGEKNFVINFVWEKGKEGGNDSAIMRSHYDNILCYCKDSSVENIITLDKKDTSRHIVELPEENLVKGIVEERRKGELFQLINLSKQKDYKVKIPLKNGEIIEWNSYAPQKSIDEWIKIGKVYVGSKRVPYIKSFLNDELQGQKPSNILGKEYGTTKSGSIEIRELFGSREVFSYPKPSTLIKRLIKIGTKKDSIILDFFSGSGTTADAVIRKNSEDNGMRKFILVQIPEKCDFRSEAFQLGFDNICSIAEKRIEIVGKKIKEETNADIDYGFRVYKVDSTNMKDVYYTANDLEQGNLAEFESNIKEDRTTDDLLIQVILDLGLSLDLKIEEKMIGKNKVYYIAGNSLVACFDDKIDINIVDKICECEPYKVVFKDSAFKIDNDKINLEERFKKLLPQRASDKGFINIL